MSILFSAQVCKAPVMLLAAAVIAAREYQPGGDSFENIGQVLGEGVTPPTIATYFHTMADATRFFLAIGDPFAPAPPETIGHMIGATFDA